ncbi:uncharacterized protein M421DRAFT_110895 [Didymella exigua CBS 183.55]|uniref:Uncharacterized protein n=1 Tax=Didymella exigua CBS 183.55 TaxID=1150837 RepID=A0A6A5S2Q5_9PLEO|nr:uncharacterized protein M421DRAFT_110895 [Didymella exigua CBS 183.55]KAF1934029.1 hypothetical protein M421DRAFT_110895 [Didymella exigua CBS 183.55]
MNSSSRKAMGRQFPNSGRTRCGQRLESGGLSAVLERGQSIRDMHKPSKFLTDTSAHQKHIERLCIGCG